MFNKEKTQTWAKQPFKKGKVTSIQITLEWEDTCTIKSLFNISNELFWIRVKKLFLDKKTHNIPVNQKYIYIYDFGFEEFLG